MKVYYFDINIPKEVEDTPEYNRILHIFTLLVMRMYGGMSIEKGLFLANIEEGENEQIFIFCDEYLHKKNIEFLDYIVSNCIGVSYNFIDVTLDVKIGNCKLPAFIKLFESEDSDFNDVYNLKIYLENYMTHNDVLSKIYEMGIDSISEEELNILNEFSKNL